MNRTEYLKDTDVQGFVTFLAGVIRSESLGLSIGFSRNQLYAGFEEKFPGGDHDYRNGGSPVYVVRAESLERLFDMYWWNRKDFEGNMIALNAVSARIKEAIEGENSSRAYALAEAACHEVMKWGFGERRRAYEANMSWAKQQGRALPQVLRMGREALSGDNPDIEAFGGDESRHPHSPRMNAGWTKYYALALPNHIIYDGRVGAALGYLVQRYLTTLSRAAGVPEKLGFLWANGVGSGTLRDPSADGHQFGKLYGGRYGSKSWAQVNVWANWILSDARDKARAEWCAGPDGLRRLEAALFMLGYDFTRARGALTEEQTSHNKKNKMQFHIAREDRTGLHTASGGSYFEYAGNAETGIQFFYGRNLQVVGHVSGETIDALQNEFKSRGLVRVGTSFTTPHPDSIGHWLLSRNNQNLACYLVPTLEHLRLGTYDTRRKKFSFTSFG
ncbi:hypothetical protein [Burkholderia vietnamiensis]|uniref:hypothetical protein n=1 Tax=Burkholderia vietnamiensis TaxID=60552 RepID=UPI00159364CB|nr:hypothetical protein [Burkholderia vietnamiensis]MCA8070027.1 hypothetical protein [Burkholderia vietnamiensis]